MSQIRAFIAIELPGDVSSALSDTRRILNSRLEQGGVRWVKTSNIHLTLRFLGNVKSDQLPALSKGLDIVAEDSNPFSLDLDVLGCFPNVRKPRVVWVGLAGEIGKLNLLYSSIEEVLATLGWEPEGRDFHPHLTLGRVKESGRVVNSQLPWGEVLAKGRIDVQAIHLIESQLLPSGAVYTIRHSGSLQK